MGVCCPEGTEEPAPVTPPVPKPTPATTPAPTTAPTTAPTPAPTSAPTTSSSKRGKCPRIPKLVQLYSRFCISVICVFIR